MTSLPNNTAGIRTVRSPEQYPTLHPSGAAGLPLLLVENPLGRAVIALQGAHVLSFQPAGQAEMLWLSPKCLLEEGKPIRGGIPLCLPWFGPGPDGKTLHGFARTRPWSVVATESLPGGSTRLAPEFSGDASVCELWPHAFRFRLELEIGKVLHLSLSVDNPGPDKVPLAFAFHTYFAVPDVARIRISGLNDTRYIDKTDEFRRKPQIGDVTISAQTDRVYLDVPRTQYLSTPASTLAITSDTRCAVVWNAWDNDRNIADLGEGNHVGYVCIERGDMADHAVLLPPGERYVASMTLAG